MTFRQLPPVSLPDPAVVERFTRSLRNLTGHDPDILGLAVSGGPDSIAMLLLAAAAFPRSIQAATVDHGLRPEAKSEAAFVGALCSALGIRHAILTVPARDAAILSTQGNTQAAARRWRFDLLRRWCSKTGTPWLLTAHHADDQAETVLMRLARGSGLAGLAAIRKRLSYLRTGDAPGPDVAPGSFTVVRPLLGFTKQELIAICSAAGVSPVADPSNDDPRYDRTHVRQWLAGAEWLDARNVVLAADHLAEAEAALDWATQQEMTRRRGPDVGQSRFVYDLEGLPSEIVRRIAADAIRSVNIVASGDIETPSPRGPELNRLIECVADGNPATLGHTLVRRRGYFWTFTPAPPRRPTRPRSATKRSD